jgi:hypothetical protein
MLLTLVILLFPVNLTFEFHLVQSLYIFDNLVLFGALYYLWLGLLLLLLFFGKGGDYEKLALVCVFALVFRGFWTVISSGAYPWQDGTVFAAHMSYLQRFGNFTMDNPILGYFNFPALPILGSTTSLISGLEIFDTATVLVLLQTLLLAALSYIFFKRTLKNALLASLAVLLLVQGNIMIAKINQLWAGNFALIGLLALLILLTRRGGDRLVATGLMIIIFSGLVTMHFVTSAAFILILLSIYLVQRASGEEVVSASTPLLLLVMVTAWMVYVSVVVFHGLVGLLPTVVQEIRGGEAFDYFFVILEGKAGPGIPFWATATRAFWWVTIFLFGTIIGLKSLTKIKQFTSAQKIITGGLVGIITVTTIAALAAIRGTEFYRFLLYGAFFIIPIQLAFLSNLGNQWRKGGLTLLITLFLLLSFPTFLAHNERVMTDKFYSFDLAANHFLESSYGQGEGLAVFGGGQGFYTIIYHLPKAHFYREPEFVAIMDKAGVGQAEAGVGQAMDELITRFEHSENSVFIYSKRLMIPYLYFLGLSPVHPNWKELEDRLLATDRIYNNGHVKIFSKRNYSP